MQVTLDDKVNKSKVLLAQKGLEFTYRMTDKYLIGIIYENSSTNRNIYLYHGPLNPLRHIITRASPRTAANKTCQRKHANITSLKIKVPPNNVVSCIS